MSGEIEDGEAKGIIDSVRQWLRGDTYNDPGMPYEMGDPDPSLGPQKLVGRWGRADEVPAQKQEQRSEKASTTRQDTPYVDNNLSRLCIGTPNQGRTSYDAKVSEDQARSKMIAKREQWSFIRFVFKGLFYLVIGIVLIIILSEAGVI